MKFAAMKGFKSIVPLCSKGKSADRFCLFPKVKDDYGPGNTPVYLNVYDLTPMNGYAYWAGFGIFHSGVEVHGVEYAFGAHDYPTSGVFEVREFMEHHAGSYNGDTYHLIVKNCNHFCNDICQKLTGNTIPKWVNRMAKLGSVFNCVLPDALRVPAVEHIACNQLAESEKRTLRSNSFSCLSSISSRQRHLSASSLILQSPLKGCLPAWELKRSISAHGLFSIPEFSQLLKLACGLSSFFPKQAIICIKTS
uniref:PPPDE domain-containing protein n=1 Tax=Tanacetum cinerariifolium TaxID=118510 RepID=A0A6L2LKU2_TANCI|nr:hypothetical protein [Tanacetum cinerariifolium]